MEEGKVKIKIGDSEIELTQEQIAAMFVEKVQRDQTPEEPKKEDQIVEQNRKLRYLNHHGKEVWLDEEQAIAFHHPLLQKGGTFLGDQNGNMTLPRDTKRKGFYNSAGQKINSPL